MGIVIYKGLEDQSKFPESTDSWHALGQGWWIVYDDAVRVFGQAFSGLAFDPITGDDFDVFGGPVEITQEERDAKLKIVALTQQMQAVFKELNEIIQKKAQSGNSQQEEEAFNETENAKALGRSSLIFAEGENYIRIPPRVFPSPIPPPPSPPTFITRPDPGEIVITADAETRLKAALGIGPIEAG